MIMPNMIYDIRTTEYAQQTLINLTGVPIPGLYAQQANRHCYCCGGGVIS